MMPAGQMWRRLILVCLLVSLGACGFQLRGSYSLPEQLSQLRLSAENLSTAQRRNLTQQLRRAGARLVDDDNSDAVLLRLSIKSLPERSVVDSAGTGLTIRRLTRQLNFSVIDSGGARLADNKTISQSIDLQLDDNNLLSQATEKQTGLQSLDDSLMNRLLMQLSRL